MSDINLLPVSDREKERKEKQKERKNKKLEFEMTDPEKTHLQPVRKSGGFWSNLKNKWFKIFGKEKEIVKPKKEIMENAPVKTGEEMANKNGVNKDLDIQTRKYKEERGLEVSTKTDLKQVEKKSEFGQKPPVIYRNFEQNFNINLIPDKEKGFITGKQKLKALLKTIVICVIGVIVVCLSYKYFLVDPNKKKFVGLDMEIEVTKQQIVSLKVGDSEKKEFLNTLRQIKEIMDKHIYFSKIFDFLEKNTLKGVYFEEMKVDTNNLSLILSVNARDYKTAAEQLLYLQSLPEIEEVELREIRSNHDEGGQEAEQEETQENFVSFNLSITLNSDFFYR